MSKDYLKKHYESLNEALVAATSQSEPRWTDRSSRQNDSAWAGTDSFSEAIDLAKHGWPEGRKKMTQAVESAQCVAAYHVSPAFSLDVGGAYPVAAIAATGDAFCMVNHAPVSDRARPTVKLSVSAANSALVKADSIFNYGAALLAIIDSLEQNDYRVELTLFFCAKCEDHKNSFSVTVKQAQDILDLDKIAFALAQPAMFRRIVFSLYELNLPPIYGRKGYGVPRLPEIGLDLTEGSVLLPSCQSFDSATLKTPAGAYKTIAPTIQQLLSEHGAPVPEIIFNGAAAA
jgi:hypothetical protein